MNPVPPLWSFLFPEHVQYQHILFLHQLSIFFSVALSRVAPVVFPKKIEEDWDVRSWRTLLEQNDQIARALDAEGGLARVISTDRSDLRDNSIQHVASEHPVTRLFVHPSNETRPTASTDIRRGHGPSDGRDGEHDYRGKPEEGPRQRTDEEPSELCHKPWQKGLATPRKTRVVAIEGVHGIEREGGRVEIEGGQESWVRVGWRGRIGPWWDF